MHRFDAIPDQRIAGLARCQLILGDADCHSPASELLAWLECEPNDPARRPCRRETVRVRLGDKISFQIPPENRFKLLYAPRWRPMLTRASGPTSCPPQIHPLRGC